ncbi:hypothetical protein PBAL39_03030 [Pedobacter sp. BAL39]|uniref:hypothetical protein n=1 Tax=Pedobacter sp. BAL39 TaxID=391596 RepID=UPI000155A6A4|nr:hypothetical protein [Pedobacter sp. BAL39]EDM34836.1 hypothetical protein PBAL39_03030 [Pedobacter sp. BAL39]
MKVPVLFICFIYGYCCQAQVLPAQNNTSDTLNSRRDFLEVYKANADLSYTSPKGELGSPQKYVIIGRLTTSYFLLAKPEIPVSFALVPDFTVKVNDERSAGVRTPSLRLGGIGYYRLKSTKSRYRYASLRFTHHSNGQDGDALNPDGSINTRDGNFSTNYLTASYHFGQEQSASGTEVTVSDNTAVQQGSWNRFNHQIGFEWHKWFSYEAALEDDYGFSRMIYNFSMQHHHGHIENWRLYAGMNYAVNQMSAYALGAIRKRLNTEVSFHYAFPFMNKAFIMASAGYYGEDPYNIYYRNKYSYLRLGVSTAL